MAAMHASIARQRESIERQRSVLDAAFGRFFPAGFGQHRAPPTCARLSSDYLREYINDAAVRERLEPDLLHAVIDQESGFYPCAVSSRGAQGLMQLMPATSQMLGVADPFNPRQSIDAGARFLSQLLSRYDGNLELALGAYNAGPARVDEHNGVPPIQETRDYVRDILERLRVKPLDETGGGVFFDRPLNVITR